jgi:Tripartite ATP-independent periplasmic transporters, DctQ component.
MEFLEHRLKAVTLCLSIAAGWALLTLAIWIVINVVLRKFIYFSFQGVDEYGGYCLAIVAALGFSQAAFDRAHVRIDVVTRLLPVPLRAVFDVIALASLSFMAWIIALRAAEVAQASLALGALAISPLRTPLVIPQSAWVAALLWFGIVLTFQMAYAVLALWRRDWPGIAARVGVPEIDQEVEQELQAARFRMGLDSKEQKGAE